MNMVVDIDDYVVSHGHNPRGQGWWHFKHGTTIATFGDMGTYGEVKRALRRYTIDNDLDGYWILCS